jgi:hypothetical protein
MESALTSFTPGVKELEVPGGRAGVGVEGNWPLPRGVGLGGGAAGEARAAEGGPDG